MRGGAGPGLCASYGATSRLWSSTLEQGVGDDRDLDKVQSRRPGYVVLTTNLLIALSRVWRVSTNIALVCLYTISSHPYEHELYILSQYQHL